MAAIGYAICAKAKAGVRRSRNESRCLAQSAASVHLSLHQIGRLGEDRTDGVRFFDARQPHVETLKTKIKALVVNTELMQNRRV